MIEQTGPLDWKAIRKAMLSSMSDLNACAAQEMLLLRIWGIPDISMGARKSTFMSVAMIKVPAQSVKSDASVVSPAQRVVPSKILNGSTVIRRLIDH